MKMERKVMHIDATIICERDSHKGIIIGKQGSMLKRSAARPGMRSSACWTAK